MRFVRRLLYTLLMLFVLLNGLLAFHAYRSTYFYDNPTGQKTRRAEEYSTGEKLQGALFGLKFPKSVVDARPAVPYQTVRLSTADGHTLEGWYIPVRQARGTVILSHGHAANKAKILAETAYFNQQGYNTLSYDFRAHGNSTGNVCTIGYDETRDLKAAWDFVVAKGEDTIVLWGVSMGAATILKAIPEYALTPARVVLECPFASLLDAVRGRLRSMQVPASPASELLVAWGSVERGMWSFDYRPADSAKDLTMPVLLLWGANDPRVSRQETDEIFANLATDQKDLVVFEESGHQSFCRNEEEKWKDVVGQFLSASTNPKTIPLAEAVVP